MAAPVLNTKKFVIRAFERKDLEAFAHYRAQEAVAQYQSWANFTYQNAVEFFEGMDYSTYGSEGNWYQLAIATKETNALVGDLGVHFVDQDQIELGVTIAPEFQGTDVATEAITRLLSYIFFELNKHRVVAITDAKNIAAHGLLEKLGFRREGHFIQNVFFKGAWGDEYMYALLRSERSE